MSPILRYYSGQGTDDADRTLAETQALDASRLEYYHDFIQWLFPLPQPSRHNPDAPVLTEADIAEFRRRPDLRDKLRRSFGVFLTFLGLEYRDGAVREAGPVRSKLFGIPNHNWLRITRALLSIKTLGLDDEARAFFAYLKGIYEGVSGVRADTFAYWEAAARGISR